MDQTQTATLSEPVSKQPNGIVLVWREYANGQIQNSGLHCYFVPKQVVSEAPYGHSISWTHYGGTSHIAKYVYIRDTEIVGHELNDNVVDSACGIKVTNNKVVLWKVLGV